MLRALAACLVLIAWVLAVPAAGQAVTAPQSADDSFTLFFQAGSVELSAEAANLVDNAARAAIRSGEKRIVVMGFADRVGSAAANLRLSRRRAQAVMVALVARGVPAAAVYMLAFGEGGRRTQTADGVREPRNRFVTITLGYPNIQPGLIIDYLTYLYFDAGSTRLSEESISLIDAAASWTDMPMREIIVAGHTDRLGSSSANLILSRRRAETVKAALVERGVPAGLIGIEASGEEHAMVETADGVPESQNRNVGIVMEPLERWPGAPPSVAEDESSGDGAADPPPGRATL